MNTNNEAHVVPRTEDMTEREMLIELIEAVRALGKILGQVSQHPMIGGMLGGR